jgi:hypothetical protein
MGDFDGHPFRGNQYTDVYHGTIESNLPGILESGLSGENVGKVWHASNRKSEKNPVYVTSTESDARKWANATAYRKMSNAPGWRPGKGKLENTVVIKIRVPTASLKSDKLGNKDAMGTAVRSLVEGSIPREWIVGHTVIPAYAPPTRVGG